LAENCRDSFLHSKVAVSMHEARQFGYGYDNQVEVLKRLYSGSDGIHRVGKLTLDTITTLQGKLPRDKDGDVIDYQPEPKVSYDENS